MHESCISSHLAPFHGKEVSKWNEWSSQNGKDTRKTMFKFKPSDIASNVFVRYPYTDKTSALYMSVQRSVIVIDPISANSTIILIVKFHFIAHLLVYLVQSIPIMITKLICNRSTRSQRKRKAETWNIIVHVAECEDKWQQFGGVRAWLEHWKWKIICSMHFVYD